jgi:polyisoprenoid-binding protein YceI
MKKITLILSTALFLIACNNGAEGDKAATTDTQTAASTEGIVFNIDSTTTITWVGSKPVGESHDGTFSISEGSLVLKDNALTAGSFTIDINSMNNIDMAADADAKGKLEGHLKSADFFDVAKYPTAKFEITSVEVLAADSSNKELKIADATHTIKGNLTLKDSTKNIAFPAKVTIGATNVTAIADFNIDRTQWGMNYKGPNNPQNWIINRDVNIKLNISATKK